MIKSWLRRFWNWRFKFLFLFISLWLVCGGLYCGVAAYTKGECFIINSDILLENKVKRFKEATNSYDIDYKILRGIFENPPSNYKIEGYIPNLYKLGPYWANFYICKFQNKGYDCFTYKINNVFQYGDNYSDDLFKDFISLNIYFFSVKPEIRSQYVNPSKGMWNVEFNTGDEDKLDYKEAFSIRMSKNDYKTLENFFDKAISYKTKYHCIHYLQQVLPRSIDYLDSSFDTYGEIVTSPYNFTWIDFFYFSAVTITTLGYGDITPNSDLVRVIMTFESIAGIILLSCFVSDLFAHNSKRKEADKQQNEFQSSAAAQPTFAEAPEEETKSQSISGDVHAEAAITAEPQKAETKARTVQIATGTAIKTIRIIPGRAKKPSPKTEQPQTADEVQPPEEGE